MPSQGRGEPRLPLAHWPPAAVAHSLLLQRQEEDPDRLQVQVRGVRELGEGRL